jgi:predicted nucleic acid-binding Zn ribbon protein
MDEIKDVLKDVFKGMMQQKKDVDFQKALDVWEKVLGPKAFKHTKSVYLTKDKIRVNVDSSAWLYDLNLKKESILRELKSVLGVQEVTFRLGEVHRRG